MLITTAVALAGALCFPGSLPRAAPVGPVGRHVLPVMQLPADCPYKTLGLDLGATDADIKSAFRKSAKLYHPDRHVKGDDRKGAEKKFKEITEAYELLLGKRGAGMSSSSSPSHEPPPHPWPHPYNPGPWTRPPGFGVESPAPEEYAGPPSWEREPPQPQRAASFRVPPPPRRPVQNHGYGPGFGPGPGPAHAHAHAGPWWTTQPMGAQPGGAWQSPNAGFHRPPGPSWTNQAMGRQMPDAWQTPRRTAQPAAGGAWRVWRAPNNAGFRPPPPHQRSAHPADAWQAPHTGFHSPPPHRRMEHPAGAWHAPEAGFRPPPPYRRPGPPMGARRGGAWQAPSPGFSHSPWRMTHPGFHQPVASSRIPTAGFGERPRSPRGPPGFVGFMQDAMQHAPPERRTVIIDGREYVEQL